MRVVYALALYIADWEEQWKVAAVTAYRCTLCLAPHACLGTVIYHGDMQARTFALAKQSADAGTSQENGFKPMMSLLAPLAVFGVTDINTLMGPDILHSRQTAKSVSNGLYTCFYQGS